MQRWYGCPKRTEPVEENRYVTAPLGRRPVRLLHLRTAAATAEPAPATAPAADPGTPAEQPAASESAAAPADAADAAAPADAAPTETPAPAADAAPAIDVVAVSRKGMGTVLQILVYPESGDREGAQKAIEAAFIEMKRVEDLMSEWNPESEVSKINQKAGGSAVPVSEETLGVLTRGKEVWGLSNGAFALTWAALASLWDFGQAEADVKRIPDKGRALDRAGLVDDAQLTLDGDKKTARLATKGMAIGLGGIAKGYAIDRALEVLKTAGFANALVFAGGDIAVRGTKGDKPWLVGVQDPRAAGYFATIPVRDEAVVSSGDYERFFEDGGKRYHHLLDPRTGYPAEGTRSVTVFGAEATFADAVATAVFVLGPDEGMKLVEAQNGYEALIVDAKNAISISSGLRDRVRVLRPPSE